ncbi:MULTISPECIES: type VII secretion system-associated protein [Actinoallomurus]|uniref:type VII secretion system-associated protein n=1 Tax=Actinoallomurus TaxID=667113 RepID=UPI0020910799|nr:MULTISPECIES: type VII secretion system-associated protein [Actinoallomurus]MCO5971950.1 type VII secretion system-associated protein [Actinoallomurus soli]MCO5994327.1 type VII secretion system-associated protein [Actinoallomurus rhizosphaericola]
MADQKKLALDKDSLQKFVDNDITNFSDSLDKIAHKTDTQGTPPIDFLLGKGESTADNDFYRLHAPLAIGALAKDSATSGKALVDKITTSAQSISDIYAQQIKLFTDLHTYLNTTIKKLMDAQHGSLDKIDGKAFLDALGTVPNDFNSAGGTQST